MTSKGSTPTPIGKPRQKCKQADCPNLAEPRRFYCFAHETPRSRGA